MNNNKECIIVIPTEYTPLNNDIKVFTDNYTQTKEEEEEDGNCGICIVFLWWSLIAILMYIIFIL